MGAFGQSFEKTFAVGLAKGADAAQDAFKEKIKKEQLKAQQDLENATIKEDILTFSKGLPKDQRDKLNFITSEELKSPEGLKAGLEIVKGAAKNNIGDDKFQELDDIIEQQKNLKSIGTPQAKEIFQANEQKIDDFFSYKPKEELTSRLTKEKINEMRTLDRNKLQTLPGPATPSKPVAINEIPSGGKIVPIANDQFSDFEAPEVDAFTGKLTDKGQQTKARQDVKLDGLKVAERKVIESNIKRKTLAQELENFFLVDDQIARGTGFIDRMKKGFQTLGKSFDQSTAEGFAAATHDGAVKRLRVQLVRAAGDVGNLNIVEQKAAEQLIPTRFDAEGTAKLKRAFLREAAKAIRSIDDVGERENEVKKIFAEFAKTEAFKGPKGEESKDLLAGKSGKLSTGVPFEVIE